MSHSLPPGMTPWEALTVSVCAFSRLRVHCSTDMQSLYNVSHCVNISLFEEFIVATGIVTHGNSL